MLKLFLLLLLVRNSNSYLNIFSLTNLKLNSIEILSNVLPKVDIFGHKILEQNKLIIEKIIENDGISIEIKKQLILEIVRLTKLGDEFGSIVLQNYEHYINHII
tara:strand:+ start:2200 stop:2511 length:312 start_codon:yes stop_codon:yes gene_type:complete